MGKGRDKRKKAKGTTGGQGNVKTARKTDKNQEKASRRAQKRAEGGEDDIDALLAKFALEDQKANAAELRQATQPSARVYSSFTPADSQKEVDLILFGGEYLDPKKDKLHIHGELYYFNTGSQEWSRLTVPKGPPPRTAHQAVVHKHNLYVFGGEINSANQDKVRHYRDLWRLDLREQRWEQLPSKGGPSARSGHRMLLHSRRLLLFGGFYDDGKKQEYHNDVWEFDIEELKWQLLTTRNQGPGPRGGCQLALHGDTMFCFGGHRVVQTGSDEQDQVYDDIWALDLQALEWAKVKKAGLAPQPRTSFGLVAHRGRAFLFGGVAEQAGKGDRIYSENFDELYQFSMDLRRWFPVSFRRAKQRKAEEQPALPKGVLSEDQASPTYQAARRIQSHYRGYVVRKAFKTYKLGGQVSELLYSPATYGVDLSSTALLKPRARQAPMMAVVKNTLWLLGGIVEVAHTDVYLDDIWCLDLAKMDGWRCIKENTAGEDISAEGSAWETDESSSQGEAEGSA